MDKILNQSSVREQKSAPLVTIAIPTYNRLNYLEESLKSALSQAYKNIEVLVGDNSGGAEIGEWVAKAAMINPRIRYQHNTHNLGMAGNWNALADSAQGEFIAILGDDDRLTPHFVSSLIPMLTEGNVVAFCNQFVIDGLGRRLETESRDFTERYGRAILKSGRLESPVTAAWTNSIPISASLIRTDLVRRLRFKEDLNTPELEFFVRLANEGHPFSFCEEYLAEYRVHPGSETAAGLKSELLSKYLLDVPVSSQFEAHKKAALAPLLVNGVGRALLQKDRALALQLWKSPYYPTRVRRTLRGALYWFALISPAAFGIPLYCLAVWCRRKLTVRFKGKTAKP